MQRSTGEAVAARQHPTRATVELEMGEVQVFGADAGDGPGPGSLAELQRICACTVRGYDTNENSVWIDDQPIVAALRTGLTSRPERR